MNLFLKTYFAAFLILTISDALWLGVISKNFYQKHLGYLLGNPKIIFAIIFYLIFVFGLVVFVIKPSLEDNSIKQAILKGALFGFIAYATYDLTNHTTIKNWPGIVTIVDLLWGTFISAFVSGISYIIIRKIS